MLSANFKPFSLTVQPPGPKLSFIDFEKFVSENCSESFFPSSQSNCLVLYLRKTFDADFSLFLSRTCFSGISFVADVSTFVLEMVFLLAEIARWTQLFLM